MTDKIRVLHICSDFEKGGVATFIRGLLSFNNSSQTHHEVLVVGFTGCALEAFSNNEVSYLALRKGCLWGLRRFVDGYNVIFFHFFNPYIILPLLVLSQPKIIFQHGLSLGSGSEIKKYVKVLWYRLLPFLLNAKVIASTEYAFLKSARRGIRIAPKRKIIIPFGTIIERRRHITPSSDNSVIKIGTAATFAPIKRINWIIESFKNYNGAHKFHVTIAGDGPLRAELSKLARSVGSDKVMFSFTGYQADLLVFYDNLDLFVFTSHDESFGLVVIEALFRNCPVAAMKDLGGALAALHSQNSVILEPSVKALADFWGHLDRDPQLIERLKGYIANSDLSSWQMNHTRQHIDQLVMEKLK